MANRRPQRNAEAQTVRAILDYLRLRGILAWRMNSRVVMLPGRSGKSTPYRMGGVKGMADIIGIMPWCAAREGNAQGCAGDKKYHIGRFIAVEEIGRASCRERV